jgi:hypothetical protein
VFYDIESCLETDGVGISGGATRELPLSEAYGRAFYGGRCSLSSDGTVAMWLRFYSNPRPIGGNPFAIREYEIQCNVYRLSRKGHYHLISSVWHNGDHPRPLHKIVERPDGSIDIMYLYSIEEYERAMRREVSESLTDTIPNDIINRVLEPYLPPPHVHNGSVVQTIPTIGVAFMRVRRERTFGHEWRRLLDLPTDVANIADEYMDRPDIVYTDPFLIRGDNIFDIELDSTGTRVYVVNSQFNTWDWMEYDVTNRTIVEQSQWMKGGREHMPDIEKTNGYLRVMVDERQIVTIRNLVAPNIHSFNMIDGDIRHYYSEIHFDSIHRTRPTVAITTDNGKLLNVFNNDSVVSYRLKNANESFRRVGVMMPNGFVTWSHDRAASTNIIRYWDFADLNNIYIVPQPRTAGAISTLPHSSKRKQRDE